jgi:transcription elongation GreA/GreB family factor
MSRAFVKESDEDGSDTLPERAISPHPNLVTEEGSKLIETCIRELESAREGAKAQPDNALVARIDRDLRYWRQRRSTARVVTPPQKKDRVRFGLRVTLRLDDGSQIAFRIVGEDEADPAAGLLSFASPIGTTLMSQAVGDAVELMGRRAEIIAID